MTEKKTTKKVGPAKRAPKHGTPAKEPAQQVTQPGYTYENPNEDETYVPVEDDDQR